jgi:hypothetical protein
MLSISGGINSALMNALGANKHLKNKDGLITADLTREVEDSDLASRIVRF